MIDEKWTLQVDNGGIYKKMQQNTGAFAMDPTIIAILVGIVIFIIGGLLTPPPLFFISHIVLTKERETDLQVSTRLLLVELIAELMRF